MKPTQYLGITGLAKFCGVLYGTARDWGIRPDAEVEGRPLWTLATAERVKAARQRWKPQPTSWRGGFTGKGRNGK